MIVLFGFFVLFFFLNVKVNINNGINLPIHDDIMCVHKVLVVK